MTNSALAITATKPTVTIHNGKAITTSLDVANFFNKQHKHVLDKISSLDCSPEFTSANFSADVQTIEIGNGARRESKIYEMTKDGFVFLVMGFTGKKAAAFKEAYIAEFNRMENELYRDMTPKQATSHTITLSDEELCSLCWLWRIADDFRHDAAQVYPGLRSLGSQFAGRFFDLANEYKMTLSITHGTLKRITSDIQPSGSLTGNWQRVLPRIRQNH
ncbi:Rha family transcriptional regulator [Serratia ureilytica]|uniref:Rha family transcriptional regulator n=1 Tax=Serratia ureilytica TaxID=300181 RepID=UPI00371D8506